MQISRHWRLNAQRYRLQGVRYENGETSLQNRRSPLGNSGPEAEPSSEETEEKKNKHSVEGDSALIQEFANPAA